MINGRKIHEIAREAIKHLRLPLLSADELTTLEDESKKDNFMPVSLYLSFSNIDMFGLLFEGYIFNGIK